MFPHPEATDVSPHHRERPDDSSRGHGGFQHQKREQTGVLSESVRSRYSRSGPDRVFTTLHKTDDVKPHLQLHENQRGKQTQRWKRSGEECCSRRVNQTCTSLSRLQQHLRSPEEEQTLSVSFIACRWWFGFLMAVTDVERFKLLVRKVLSSR